MNVGKVVASTMRLPQVMLSVMFVDVPTQTVRRLTGNNKPTRRVTRVPAESTPDKLSDTSKGSASMKTRRKRV